MDGEGVTCEVRLQMKSQADLATLAWFWREKEGNQRRGGGKTIPGSPAREQSGGQSSDVRRACQSQGQGALPGFRCNEFMAMEIQPRAGGANLELRERPEWSPEVRGGGHL